MDMRQKRLGRVSTFVRTLGLNLTEMSGERVAGYADLAEEHETPWGFIHGGVACSIIESAASIGASLYVEERGQFAVGVNNSTDFIRPAPHGRVEVTALPVHQGTNHQLWQAELFTQDGKLVARGTVRLQNLPLPKNAESPFGNSMLRGQ